jgi:oligoribonuclease NrnB/cAMP/cGMP phosphodiesterase (DHH superfamily)
VFNHNAQQIQLSLLMEDVKPVEMVPIQIQVEDNVLDYNATTGKELLKQAQHQNVLIAQSEPELKIMELDAVLTNATQLTENILKKMEHATHVHLIKL